MVREMAEPSRWPEVMKVTYLTAVPLYFVCGLLGYYAYGDFALANLNLNFPDNLANRLSIGVQLVAELFFVLDSDLVGVFRPESYSPGVAQALCARPPPARLRRFSRQALSLTSSRMPAR